MQDKSPIVTFIIPAKNEETMLPATLDSIHQVINNQFEYEVIVVDNGSTDNTPSIAESKSAKVIIQSSGTIGSLRNNAARIAKGDCLVFIDADVCITSQWLNPFLETLDAMNNNKELITGSRCTVDEKAGWIANSWFRQAPNAHHVTHIGTGHMIVNKALFSTLNGFNEQLQTGEDYEFCVRAVRNGATLFENHKLKVIHYGIPKSLLEFIKREIWHGMGDTHSLRTLVSSKVALISLIFSMAHIGLITVIIIDSSNYLLSLFFISIIVVLVSASTYKKYHYFSSRVIIRNLFLFYIYFWARTISIINKILSIKRDEPRAGRPK